MVRPAALIPREPRAMFPAHARRVQTAPVQIYYHPSYAIPPLLYKGQLEATEWFDMGRLERDLILIEVFKDGIGMITPDWFPSQVSPWSYTWNLFQMTLVLILAFVSDRECSAGERCSGYIESAHHFYFYFYFYFSKTDGAILRWCIQVLDSAVRHQETMDHRDSFDVIAAL